MEGTVYVNPWGQTVPSMFQEEQGDRHAQSGWSEWMLVANETREVAEDWIMWRLEDHAKRVCILRTYCRFLARVVIQYNLQF